MLDDPDAYRRWREARPEPPVPPSATPFRLTILVGDADIEHLAPTLASLRAQTHAAWSLTVAARLFSPWARAAIRVPCDPRIRLRLLGPEEDPPPAPDGWHAVLPPGDRLAPTALAMLAHAARLDPDADALFADDDELGPDGPRRPRFKCKLFDPAEAEGAILFARGRDAGRRPLHLPRVIHHRAEPSPIVVPPPPPEATPPVTIVMPTRDRALAAVALADLEETDYPALRVTVIDHGAGIDAARRVPWNGPFNFAAMNNAAARDVADGVIVLLNDDIRVIDPGWLRALATHAMRPDTGIVGARLLYPDGTLQHGGIALGPGGRTTHILGGAEPDEPGYLGWLTRTREVAAVTGACLAIRAEIWRAVGGMNERLALVWNDVDLCLRVRAAGHRVLWTPDATLIHLESRTRGRDDAAVERDRAIFRGLWGDAAEIDPCLNPNLVVARDGVRLAGEAP